MDYKIIGWIIASFNSAFNGNSMVRGNQMVAPNNNAYPVASSSTWNNTADTGDSNRIIGQNGWTEDEEGAKYASFVKEHIDPNAVITPEEKLIGGWLQQKYQAPMDPLACAPWKNHQPNRQIATESYLDCISDVDRIEKGSSHRLVKNLTAPRSGVQFYFKFDKALSDDEIKDMTRDFEEAINNYEQQIGLPSSSLLHNVYVDKWNQVKGNYSGMYRMCYKGSDEMQHLMGVYLGGEEHPSKHEMGHVLHYVHTQGMHVPPLIAEGIAQYCSLSDKQKREAVEKTLELFQRNGSFSTINSIKQLCEEYKSDDRYKVGPTLIQYIQDYYKGGLQAYLDCKGDAVQAYSNQCSTCMSHLNINTAGFKSWLEWKISINQIAVPPPTDNQIAVPPPTDEPVIRTTRHALPRVDKRCQPTVPRLQPTMPRDDRRPQLNECDSVAYLRLVCEDEKCFVIRNTRDHTSDCTLVAILNPHAKEVYVCDNECFQLVGKKIQEGSGILPASYIKNGTSIGCNLISPVTTTSATPTDGANSGSSYSIYWFPATIVGGVASSTTLSMGVKKFYNKYCW